MRETLMAVYRDYLNNYLTVEKWAEHNGLTTEHGVRAINLARDVATSDHPEA